ncbi:hypothetical protein NN561_016333 [Cricetulus griseus]
MRAGRPTRRAHWFEFPEARPIRTRTGESRSQWAAPLGTRAERQGNAVTAVNSTWRFVKGTGTAAARRGRGEVPGAGEEWSALSGRTTEEEPPGSGGW